MKNCVFGVGTLPQAPFFGGKLRSWSRNVAAGAFFGEKLCVLVKTKDEGFPAKVS